MSALAIDSGTLVQLITMGAGIALVWSQMREAIAEMRSSSSQIREAVTELKQHRDRDGQRIGSLERGYARHGERLSTLERIVAIRPDNDREPHSDEDERG